MEGRIDPWQQKRVAPRRAPRRPARSTKSWIESKTRGRTNRPLELFAKDFLPIPNPAVLKSLSLSIRRSARLRCPHRQRHILLGGGTQPPIRAGTAVVPGSRIEI